MNVPDLDIHPLRIFRVFFAHAKGDDDRQVDAWRDHIASCLSAVAPPNTAVVVTLGRTDHEENFKRCGSWDAWARDVVDRVDYVTREDVYHAIVSPHEYIGKATAQIVSYALLKSKPVLRLLGDGAFRPVRIIEQVSDSFKNGWHIR